MAHANETVTIDPILHADLRKAASLHPAAAITGSPLANALAADNGTDGHITNTSLTAYLAAVHTGPQSGTTAVAHSGLIARLEQAFPGR